MASSDELVTAMNSLTTALNDAASKQSVNSEILSVLTDFSKEFFETYNVSVLQGMGLLTKEIKGLSNNNIALAKINSQAGIDDAKTKIETNNQTSELVE